MRTMNYRLSIILNNELSCSCDGMEANQGEQDAALIPQYSIIGVRGICAVYPEVFEVQRSKGVNFPPPTHP